MTTTRPCAIGFGELLWDVLPHATLPGGAPTNFAWHAEQLGAHGAVVSAVGNDQPGRDLARWLGEIGLRSEHVQVNGKPTGRVDVTVDAGSHEPRYVIGADAAWDAIEWNASLDALAHRADCVCFGSLAQRSPVTRETLYRFLRSTRPRCLRVFDVNLRQPMPKPDVIRNSIELANVLKLNECEWPFVASCVGLSSDWSTGAAELLRRTGVQLVAVTRGAKGSVILTANQALEQEADLVEVEDTIGAGDAFAATLAVGLLYGMPLAQVQAAATRVSAFVCTRAGATPSLPAELREMMTIPTTEIHLPMSGPRAGKQVVVPLAGRPAQRDAMQSPS